MPRFVVAAEAYELEPKTVEDAVEGVLPDPVQEHYVVIGGRRYPPKQVLSRVTGLDRADFTTHQARRILKRLGFVAARVDSADGRAAGVAGRPRGHAQATALAPYVGKWVALSDPTTVLAAADSPEEVLAWLTRHERRASYGMFRVPTSEDEAQGTGPL